VITIKNIYVALSGGVDSAVAAILLKEQGYNVIGVTLRLKPGNLADGDIADAKAVADKLCIPLEIVDLRNEFKTITDYFCREYINGKTPNPCVLCNPTIKLGKLVEHALKNGVDYVATGHYAEITKDSDGEYLIKRNPSGKDQSYFLCRLNQHILSHVIFPIAELTKPEIREIAEKNGIPVAQKKDSQEVCFIPDNDYISFIEREFSPEAIPGDFVSPDGEKLGTHAGIYKYTIGQRKGLGIALGAPKHVLKIDAHTNTVVLGDHDELYTSDVQAVDVRIRDMQWLTDSPQVTARIRYKSPAVPATVQISQLTNNLSPIANIHFDQPVWGVTPGQSLVIYKDGLLVGGGIIQ
jgi:tRNA-specific 2-thiouridylase